MVMTFPMVPAALVATAQPVMIKTAQPLSRSAGRPLTRSAGGAERVR
jgi:hypothetical protein